MAVFILNTLQDPVRQRCSFHLPQTPHGASTRGGVETGQCVGLSPRANAVSPVPRPVPQLANLPFKALQKRWVEDALQKKVLTELGNKTTSVMIKRELGEKPKKCSALWAL